MLRNYIIIAIRHITRHKLFSAINVFCLAIGITFTMLIWNYVSQEKEVNRGLRNADNQYLIKSKWKVKDMGIPLTTLGPLAKTLKKDYPSLVNNYYRFNPVTNVVSAGEKHFKQNISICDTTLISMYGFELLKGDPARAFPNSSSAIITDKLAMKLYGTTDAVNKTITITTTSLTQQDYQVSAVLKSMKYNSVNNLIDKAGHDVFVPFQGNRFFQSDTYMDDWSNMYIVGMIELKDNVKPSQLVQPVKQLLSLNLPDNLKGLLDVELVKLSDHYQKDNNGAVEQMTSALSLVALFILLMAVINFVNISIGTSTYRLKEIGLRKVFGGERKQLIIQYLVESLVLTFVAALISLGLYEFARPMFEQLLATELDAVTGFGAKNFAWLLLFVAGLGLTAGIYPAFILSAAKIISSVKGNIDTSHGGLVLRKTLLVVQFTLAIFIFISAVNVSRQVSYFFNKDLGYNKEHLLVVTAFPKQWDSAGVLKMEAIRNGLMQLPVVQDASVSFEVPDRLPPATTDLLPVGDGGQKPVVVPTIMADERYASTFGLKLLQGTFLSARPGTETRSEIVLNESAAKVLGVKAGAETVLKMPDGFNFVVTGVVKDFNFSSFQQLIGPMAFIPTKLANRYRYLTLKIKSPDMANAIDQVKTKWNQFSPGNPFEYTFMDDRFKAIFETELKLKKAAQLATVLNLLIVFMGVFGIVAFTLARRTREIAVRKVLGADVKNIISLFVRDYALLIIIANLIAWPVAYFATDTWLRNYSYRIEQNLIPYFVVAAIVTGATFLFISAQCLKTALTNPVKNLRAD